VPTHLDYQEHDVMDWLSVLEWEDRFQRSGVRMANLSSFSAHDPKRKAHAFYAFCVSKLWDCLHYTKPDRGLDGWLRDVRLGRPLADKPGSWGAVLYREYEGALVAVNPYGVAQLAHVPWTDKPADATVFRYEYDMEVSEQTLSPAADGTIEVKLLADRAALIVPRQA